jgi:hypothetical protein
MGEDAKKIAGVSGYPTLQYVGGMPHTQHPIHGMEQESPMSVIKLRSERRRRRSSSTYEAIRFQLEHLYHQYGLRNFTLGDSRGLVLAHAGHPQEADVIAAYAPILASCVDKQRQHDIIEKIQRFIPDAAPQTVQVRSFEVDGETLHLTVVAETDGKHADLYRAVSGIRRILARTSATVAA